MCGGQDLLIGGVAAAKADITHHRVVEEQHVLEDDRVIAQQRLGVHARDIHAAHGNRARSCIPEAGGQAAHRRFARAGWANKCRDLPFLRGEAHICQDLLASAPVVACAVAERHVIKDYIMAGGLELLAALRHGLLHDGAHTFGG